MLEHLYNLYLNLQDLSYLSSYNLYQSSITAVEFTRQHPFHIYNELLHKLCHYFTLPVPLGCALQQYQH